MEGHGFSRAEKLRRRGGFTGCGKKQRTEGHGCLAAASVSRAVRALPTDRFSRRGTAFPTHCDEIRQESRTPGPKGLDSVVVFGTAKPVPFRSSLFSAACVAPCF